LLHKIGNIGHFIRIHDFIPRYIFETSRLFSRFFGFFPFFLRVLRVGPQYPVITGNIPPYCPVYAQDIPSFGQFLRDGPRGIG
jgi:hypothetical protein